MNKTMLALTLSALAGTATAQTSVSVYGIVDMALVRESGGAASATKLTSGVESGSRLGFKGSEDLGNGLSALFLLESGFQVDTGVMGQGGLLFGRQAYVGLQSRAGTLTLGRQYTPQYLAVAAADPFGSGMAGDTKNLMAATGNSASRMDNAVKYASPLMNGISAELVYGAGEVAGDNSASRQFGGALGYANGGLNLKLAHHNRNNDTAALKNTSSAKNMVVTAVYDFGVAKGHFAYGRDKGLNSAPLRNAANPFAYAVAPVASTDSSATLLGVTVPRGQHVLLASWIRKDDRTALNQDADQFALGYRYYLSKRTDVYTAYAHMRNKNGAGYTVGSAIEGGSGNSAVNLGMRHTF
ncbi:porin [Oxalobacteraceae bacterium]|nr:porin [Oxalobacteraceae bacterium]